MHLGAAAGTVPRTLGAIGEMAAEQPRFDRRALRATGRTKAFGTKVSEEFYRELRMYAAKHGLKLVEVLERGHEALKERDRQNAGRKEK